MRRRGGETSENSATGRSCREGDEGIGMRSEGAMDGKRGMSKRWMPSRERFVSGRKSMMKREACRDSREVSC